MVVTCHYRPPPKQPIAPLPTVAAQIVNPSSWLPHQNLPLPSTLTHLQLLLAAAFCILTSPTIARSPSHTAAPSPTTVGDDLQLAGSLSCPLRAVVQLPPSHTNNISQPLVAPYVIFSPPHGHQHHQAVMHLQSLVTLAVTLTSLLATVSSAITLPASAHQPYLIDHPKPLPPTSSLTSPVPSNHCAHNNLQIAPS